MKNKKHLEKDKEIVMIFLKKEEQIIYILKKILEIFLKYFRPENALDTL